MDRIGVRLEPKRGGDPDEVEMVLGLKERGRLFFKAGTEVGGGEGGGVSDLFGIEMRGGELMENWAERDGKSEECTGWRRESGRAGFDWD